MASVLSRRAVQALSNSGSTAAAAFEAAAASTDAAFPPCRWGNWWRCSYPTTSRTAAGAVARGFHVAVQRTGAFARPVRGPVGAGHRAAPAPRLPASCRCLSARRPPNPSTQQSNWTIATYMVAIIVGMLGFTYFSVPLYRIFCAATGYGGTVSEGRSVEEKLRKRREEPNVQVEEAAAKREVTVTFVSEVQPGLPWSFKPCQKSVRVRPGQSTLVFYNATNNSEDDITGVSTYNVAPPQVGYFFNKIQCFCFEEQRLRPGESIDMPVFFYLDPEFATDRRLRNVNDVILSYVFFKTGELPKNADGSELVPGESMPAELLPSRQVA